MRAASATGIQRKFTPMHHYQELSQQLARHFLFGDIPDKDLARDVCPAVRVLRRNAGDCFYQAGDDCEAVYLVLDGEVVLTRQSLRQHVIVGRIGANGFFGEQTILKGHRMHNSRAEAYTDTVCVEITRRNFKYLQQRFPSIMVRMLESESSKGRSVLDHLHSIRLDPVMLRVVRALLGLAKSAGTTVLTDLGHQDIADSIGTNRETVTNVLHDLSDKGLITRGRMQVTLDDVAGLQRLLGGGVA